MHSIPYRRWLLGALLLTTLALVGWAATLSETEPEVVAATLTRPEAIRAVQAAPGRSVQQVTLALPEREPIVPGGAFGTKSWFVPPPPPPEPPPPPQAALSPSLPNAPPLPYVFIGTISLADGSEVLHFLHGTDLRAARIGDTIDHDYRLDERGRNAIVFTYLPLSQRQYLILDQD